MEIAQLEAFVTAAECGSFSRAAELLNVAQPSLSNRIQALEREVGQSVFERMGRGVRLTDSGRAFLPYAERILRALEDGRMVLQNTRQRTAGQLVIATAPAVGTYVLPRILQVYCERYPGIDVMCRTGHSEEVLQKVVADDVQVGFGRPLYHPELSTNILYDEELVLVVADDHKYAKRGEVSVAELANESLILFDRDSGYHAMILNVFREQGVTPHQQMQLDNIEATKKMVEANLGIALLPAVAVDREIKLGTLHKVRIGAARPIRQEIGVMFRRNKPQSGAMEALLELVGEMYEVNLQSSVA